MKICIIPISWCYSFYQNSASERFRCDWLLEPLNAKKYNGSQNLDNYDAIIYQKAHSRKAVELSKKYKHKIQIFDSVDPEWLFPEGRHLKELIVNMDFIITSTEKLAEGFRQFNKPVYTIPDRHNLKYYQVEKNHEDKKSVLVWFGYSENFERIKPLLPIIKAYNLELITICDKPVYDNAKFVKWDYKTVNEEIIKGDIVLNLPDQEGYKSNNKTVSAWLLKMPVVEKISDLFKFLDYKERIKEANGKYIYAKENYDIKIFAKEINNLIKGRLKI